MLNERKKLILQAITELYINTAEPVSSNAILENYDLACSSATIRNEMMELEHLGFLEKPHTSSGRIPSGKGYRLILSPDILTYEEIQEYLKTFSYKIRKGMKEFQKFLDELIMNSTEEVSSNGNA